MKQINLHEHRHGAQPGLAPKPYCARVSGSWECHWIPLCYCLLIPAAEVGGSLLHWAVGKMVQFTRTKYLQRCRTLCWHYSHDSNNSLIFYLFFSNEYFPKFIFLSVPGRQECKVGHFLQEAQLHPHYLYTPSHTSPCHTVIWDRTERHNSLHFYCFSGTAPGPLCTLCWAVQLRGWSPNSQT